jgi:hypothetical protein
MEGTETHVYMRQVRIFGPYFGTAILSVITYYICCIVCYYIIVTVVLWKHFLAYSILIYFICYHCPYSTFLNLF